MNTNTILRFATTLAAITVLAVPFASHAEVRSKSGEIVVMEPHNLPVAARQQGDAFFLHATSFGSFYLYIEQQQGARLTVLDVTNPAHIQTVSTVEVPSNGPYDFVRSLGDRAELIHLRNGNGVAILDLSRPARPTLHPTNVVAGKTESLGETALLQTAASSSSLTATARDFEVVDLSRSTHPVSLTIIRQVSQRLQNEQTGSIFLLGTDGLTVIRHPATEEAFEIHQMQMQGN